MWTIVLSIVAGGLAGGLVCYVVLRLPEVRAQTAAAEATTTAGESAEPLATALTGIGQDLQAPADATSHPSQVADLPGYKAALAAMRRPEATTELIGQYALGDNWPLACAAFTVLAERPDRQSLCDAALRRLTEIYPYPVYFAVRYFTSLPQRPPVGAVFAAVQDWWQSNSAIRSALQDYLVKSAELGDRPVFGDSLDRQKPLEAEAIARMLQALQHPFATELLAALRNWQETRVDREYLRSVGTLWEPAEQDKLLVLPQSWNVQLASALQALRQRRPRSLLVCGDPHVGKTAFISLLSAELRNDGWTVFAASGTTIMADQSYIGELEGRVRKMIEALHARRRIVWVVGDMAQMASAGMHRYQTASVLDQILPAIIAGELIVIGESAQTAATHLFQVRPSLRPLIELVPLQAMDDDATATLAHQVAARIAAIGKVSVPAPAVDAAMDLALHYLGAGRLPGVALELLKRAADRSIAAGESALSPDSVVATLSQISGLPEVILNAGQRVDLDAVRAFFAHRVMGQDEAVRAIVDRIAMLKAGLTDPGKPIGVFLFAGPTGTGKTELAKTTAEFLFGSPDRLVRLDMSEFQNVESMAKIIGRDDRGGDSLIDRIRKQPFSVVLLDEFEKAHPNCWDLFLQMFDDGRLSDASGNEADFRHCIIILTSNLGATLHRGSGLGFLPDPGIFTSEQVMKTIEGTFRPEFVNRIDKVIVFRQLSRELMRIIVHKELAAIEARRGLRERAWAVEWEASAIEFLLDRGFSLEMGARPLKRAIDQHLLAPLAATLVEHRFPEGDQFLFVRSNGQAIEVEFVDPDAGAAEPAPPEDGEEAERSLPAIILRPLGTAEERASLAAHWRQIEAEIAGEAWHAQVDELRQALADPDIWQRTDRHCTFSRMELADRIAEAARTAEGLLRRYEATRGREARAARELGGRLALQLWNVAQGLADFRTDAPVDALLRIEPILDAGDDGRQATAWCQRLNVMYRQWAEKRRLKLRELLPSGGTGLPILHISGFGAFHVLATECGLHVFEDEHGQGGTTRVVARVGAVGGPSQADFSASDAYAVAHRLLAASPASTTIVRRYRERPAPIVRDVANWRSGRLSAVLGGDFDLVGATKRQAARV
ncbi:MAG: AAA family ATPase [Alphaproteobacteria bacterium]|nr:AAA family ATPase [Alphaproteobacteria bacterium]MCW5739863.1 AAA family ATPase [Alphaproteobacteria bacterium]